MTKRKKPAPVPAPTCTCDETKVESRGECAEHGFKSRQWLTPERVAANDKKHKALAELLDEVLAIAEDTITAGCDGEGEPLYSDADRIRLRATVTVIRDRMAAAEKPVRFVR